MSDKLFRKLWNDALQQPDLELYIAECGYPDYFDEISEEADTVIQTLTNIHKAANMSFREILKASGLTQAAFSDRFCIPKRNIENWSTGASRCSDYDRLMMIRILGLVQV